MKIQTVPLAQLNPAPYNPRKDLQPGDQEYEFLKKSIDKFNLVEPIVWNQRTGNVVGGHQRLKIIQRRGDTEVEVSVMDLSKKDEAALNIALNKIGGEWDFPKLKDIIVDLDDGELDMDLLGFGEDELNEMMGVVPKFQPASEDEQGRLDQKNPVTCPECGVEFVPKG